jgi:hypothetical protein
MRDRHYLLLTAYIISLLGLLAVVLYATKAESAGQEPRTAQCGGHPHLHGIRAYDDLLARSWERSDPYDDEPRAQWQIERLRHYRACARGDRVHRLMREHAAEARRDYRRWQERIQFRDAYLLERYAYRDQVLAAGYWAPRWVAIPSAVVWCESGPEGTSAHNEESGSTKLYQFIPSTYFSVCESCDWSMRDQHIAASRVWDRSGGAEWSCA